MFIQYAGTQYLVHMEYFLKVGIDALYLAWVLVISHWILRQPDQVMNQLY